MPYRLLLPATLDVVPGDVHDALKPFGAKPLADRGCAWQLPEGGAPGVAEDVAPVIVRLLPGKALQRHPDEPAFRVPKGTQRAVEVITPAETPAPRDCQRVHDCATALAEALHLGILNPYRGIYCDSADAYVKGLTDPPAADSLRVRAVQTATRRSGTGRTEPAAEVKPRRTVPRAEALAAAAADSQPGLLSRALGRLRGTRRYHMRLPAGARPTHVRALMRQARAVAPMARLSADRRRRVLMIEAPDSPLVHRTILEFIERQRRAIPRTLEVSMSVG